MRDLNFAEEPLGKFLFDGCPRLFFFFIFRFGGSLCDRFESFADAKQGATDFYLIDFPVALDAACIRVNFDFSDLNDLLLCYRGEVDDRFTVRAEGRRIWRSCRLVKDRVVAEIKVSQLE